MGTFVKAYPDHQHIPRSFIFKHQNVTFIIKMKFSTILTLVGAAVASPVIEERQETIDPLSASLAVFNALPTSLRDMALTNPAAGVSATGAIASATGSAASEASEAASSASGALSSAAADASAAVSSAAGGLSSLASSASAAASSATSDSGAMPTQVIAGGFAGVAGLMAVLAL